MEIGSEGWRERANCTYCANVPPLPELLSGAFIICMSASIAFLPSIPSISSVEKVWE